MVTCFSSFALFSDIREKIILRYIKLKVFIHFPNLNIKIVSQRSKISQNLCLVIPFYSLALKLYFNKVVRHES